MNYPSRAEFLQFMILWDAFCPGPAANLEFEFPTTLRSSERITILLCAGLLIRCSPAYPFRGITLVSLSAVQCRRCLMVNPDGKGPCIRFNQARLSSAIRPITWRYGTRLRRAVFHERENQGADYGKHSLTSCGSPGVVWREISRNRLISPLGKCFAR